MSVRQREARISVREAPDEGAVRMLEVGGQRVGLYRVGDELYALADRCPHRGAPICSGRIATPIEAEGDVLVLGQPRSVLRCPWHKWEFDIATGRSLVDDRLRVRTYAVRLEGEHVVVALDRPGG
jgi:3-phenylpropionate/trans-cinnamate dioxygenase ferredoxin subunit